MCRGCEGLRSEHHVASLGQATDVRVQRRIHLACERDCLRCQLFWANVLAVFVEESCARAWMDVDGVFCPRTLHKNLSYNSQNAGCAEGTRDIGLAPVAPR